MATKTKENLVKMKCSVCKRITYYTSRNKKKIKEKLELKKYCKFCKKHTLHKEAK
ncbi:MAG TPA: 50S ribosomal protein L33 [Candidatus Moranbacteria bacterium]|nr:50S ribosomal protein L33 [Candidatus Moranbacteria bacterium]HPX93970.1 50S ribosomal protein L33 [Candidatus Moranbacteria bacterium]HQB59303.1 50S ribosomal protein L33 [Candidatus Moranbacteria bacterium]